MVLKSEDAINANSSGDRQNYGHQFDRERWGAKRKGVGQCCPKTADAPKKPLPSIAYV